MNVAQSVQHTKRGVRHGALTPVKQSLSLDLWNRFTFIAFCVLLVWIAGEIVCSLWKTHTFWPLAVLFCIAALPIVVSMLIRQVTSNNPEVHGSGPLWWRGVWALIFLNAATAIGAFVTARILKPAYDFTTPVLRLTAYLMDYFFRS